MPSSPSTLRILDANLNRAREGLRVCEEHARFALENPAWAARLKDVRHRLRAAEELLVAAAGSPLSRERDTAGDCGTAIKTAAEAARPDAGAVVAANLKRAQEALRVLGEYGKTLSAEAAALCEAARYALYDLEPLLVASDALRARLRRARLYVLVTTDLCTGKDPLAACREAVDGGADMIQLREKNMEDGEFLALATKMQEICADRALFLVDDRAHVSRLLGTSGVHVGQGDLPVGLARRLVGPSALIGLSTHAPEQALAGVAAGADCFGVGPVYPTQTKQHRASVGLEYVRWAVANCPVPYHAIGGVNRETAEAVLDTGCFGIAICTGVISAPDVAAAAAWFREKIDARPAAPLAGAAPA